MSKQITKTLYWFRSIEHDYESFDVSNFPELCPNDYMALGKCEVAVFDMAKTDAEILAARVDALESQKTQVRAAAQAKLTDLDNKIQSLLSITHQPEEA